MARTKFSDPRLQKLRKLLAARSDEAHAEFHKEYHKSSRDFYGLRTPQLMEVIKEVFPTRPALEREDALALIDALWYSNWAEENSAAIYLLQRVTPQLGVKDLPLLKRMVGECSGWGSLDGIAINSLSPLALAQGEPVYRAVRKWSDDAHMWTRRAAILVHVVPARRHALNADYAFPTFAERLFEKEFFIRKAIGWALRECSKHYPEETAQFITQHSAEMSGLTRREGARNLPDKLRKSILGK